MQHSHFQKKNKKSVTAFSTRLLLLLR